MSTLWNFDEFDCLEPDRAALLRKSPPWPELIRRACYALREALEKDAVRFGFDASRRDPRDLRAVIQYPVGVELFDWLFNSHTGYRAQFRIGQENGLLQNAQVVTELCTELRRSITQPINARRLSHEFQDFGPMTATIDQIATSLDPRLSKLWICEKQIGNSGGVHDLFVSRTGPRLSFLDTQPWSSLYPEDADGWLDIKGAFTGPGGAYQVKSPEQRSATLEERGTA